MFVLINVLCHQFGCDVIYLGTLHTACYYYVMIWLLLNFVFGMVLKVRKDDEGGPELHIENFTS
jgi:hypothetical protein